MKGREIGMEINEAGKGIVMVSIYIGYEILYSM